MKVKEVLATFKRVFIKRKYKDIPEVLEMRLSDSFEKREEEPAVECIEKGILEDVLVKHRAEVEDMFLTRFDKKMYEEALKIDAREEGRAEGRAEEQINTERERQRADEAEAEIARLREENSQLKKIISNVEK